MAVVISYLVCVWRQQLPSSDWTQNIEGTFQLLTLLHDNVF